MSTVICTNLYFKYCGQKVRFELTMVVKRQQKRPVIYDREIRHAGGTRNIVKIRNTATSI